MTLRRFFLLALFASVGGGLNANESATPPSVSVDIPSLVHGCVDVVSGAFFWGGPDLMVKGAEPIPVYRLLCSAAYDEDSKAVGVWRLGGVERVRTYVSPERPRELKLWLEEATGGVVHFEPEGKWDIDLGRRSEWDAKVKEPEKMTNIGNGTLSGQTDKANYWLRWSHSDYEFTLTTGVGEKRVYKHRGKKDCYGAPTNPYKARPASDTFYLSYVRKPNGHSLHYSYDRDNRITEIQACGGGAMLSWVRYTYEVSGDRQVVRAATK